MSTVPMPERDDLGALVVGPARLVEGAADGPLAGRTAVVKDLYDVIGTRTGAGNPDFLADAPVAASSAPAVDRLTAAGVTVVGKSVTDELAYSLSGTNVHYGTPHNPAAPGRVPGGSSSGSASAVAGELVDVALGTDTGGSVRVPASWTGLFGMRPTHGRIPLEGVVPLAPSSDTVGWFARSGAMLAALGRALLHAPASGSREVRHVLVADDLLALVEPAAAAALLHRAGEVAELLVGRPPEVVRVVPADDHLHDWFRGYRVRQQWEAWRSHGDWIARRRPTLGPGISARFDAAAAVTHDDVEEADKVRARVRRRMADLVPDDTVLVTPVTMGPPPPARLTGPAKAAMRTRMLAVNSIAGSTGSPTVVVPGARVAGRPVGLGLLGAPGTDTMLLDAAAVLDRR